MASDADGATAALFKSIYTGNYCAVAASALFLYDALVTIDREVACFWTSRWTGAPLLFFANRWISVTYSVMELVRFASFPSNESCSSFEMATAAILVLQFLPGAVFSALRTFVLSKSKLFGSLVFLLSLAPLGANLVFFGYGLSGQNFSPFGCAETDRITAAIEIRLVYISRVPLIVADVLLIYVTWTKLSSRGAMTTIRQSKRLSLSDILLRDGTIYFVVLFMLNLLHLVFSVTAVIADSGGSYLSVFTSPVTAILISRFLLELQEANQTVVRLDPDDPLHSSRHPFGDLYTPSFIASLGAFIPPDRPTLSDSDSGFDSLRGSSSDSREEEDATQSAASSFSV